MRNIDDILLFRTDLSPFLAHLTRASSTANAHQNLESILSSRELRAGNAMISDARFGGSTLNMPLADQERFFGAVCFTETPLSEVHSLLEIYGRSVNLEPYGLVFSKEQLRSKGVSPVVYLHNDAGSMDCVFRTLFGLCASDPVSAELLLPLIAVCGDKVMAPGASQRPLGKVDFAWEREWRHRSSKGSFKFVDDDVFCGLCPHEEISHFESKYPPYRFIDPRRAMKWYAEALIDCRHRLSLKNSVV